MPIIQYRTEFYREENGKLMVHWQIQPDGRYWADECVFGAENDVEIVLYAYITEVGRFEAPFRIYELGNTRYYGTELEEEEKKEYIERQEVERERIESGETVDEAIHRYVGYACKNFAEIAAETTKQFFIQFDIPDSNYVAMLRMEGREPEWAMHVDVKIRGTIRLFSNGYTKLGNPGMHSRAWLIEQVKTPEFHEFMFDAIKHLCERIARG